MKLKRIGLIALSLTTLFAAAACSGNNDNPSNSSSGSTQTTQPTQSTQTTQPSQSGGEEYPDVQTIERDTEYREIFSSLSINTDNVKKVYYLGDTFDTTGLVVTQNYLSYDKVTNKRVDIPAKKYETREYSIDSSEVDMTSVGKYKVYITSRVGTTIKTANYQIEVKSSVFESTPNIEYICGVDVSYSDNTAVKTYTVTDPIPDLKNDLQITVHKRMVNQDLTFTDSVINYDVDKLTIDDSQVDNQKVGHQMIKVTYDGGNVNVGGVDYENKVSSYVLVNVKNDALSIEGVSSNKDEFKATLDDLDFSSWKIKIEREVGTETVNFSYDLFEIDDLDQFKWDQLQTITVRLKENPTIKYFPDIYIEESNTQVITKYVDLKPVGATALSSDGKNYTMADVTPDSDGFYATANNDFIFMPGAEKSDDLAKMYAPRTQDAYGSLLFPTRVTIKGAKQPIKIVMDKPGNIVAFYASTGDEERELTLTDSEFEEIETAVSSDVKQKITKHIFTCSEAGTYYIVNPSGGMWIHGFVIATNK